MFNSKQMKLAIKAAQNIAANDKMIKTTISGVIEDIKNKVHSDHDMVIPMWGQSGTQGAITAIEGWDKKPEILDHLIGAIQGRMLHFYIMEHVGVNLYECNLDQAAQIVSVTDDQQGRILKQLVGEEAYTAYKTTQQKEMDEYLASHPQPIPGSVEF